ncbi:MAG: hypothetical protein J6Y20_05110 [Lachnospiraceae bacterium]|nr:hypothetical protein [Lachnospiraceae bacterium]
MENEKRIPDISADKALLHNTYSGRRLLIAMILLVVVFITTVIGGVEVIRCFTAANTEREKNILEFFAKNYGVSVTEVLNGQGDSP